MATRVLLVDDHALVRDGLRRSLEVYKIHVAGEAGDGATALRLVAELDPDVVLMDVALPDMDGVAVTKQLVAAHPEVPVVMLTMYGDQATIGEAIAAGAAAYVVKDCTTAEIAAVIDEVAAGETALSPALAETMLRAARHGGVAILSAREREVLQLIAEGSSTTEVAARLYITPKTTKNHLASIYHKLEATDRTQAVLQGLRKGIIRLR